MKEKLYYHDKDYNIFCGKCKVQCILVYEKYAWMDEMQEVDQCPECGNQPLI
ncbi:MAG: hypothetical protein KAS32_01835 [Candidatus Peribacteraceae bacterium]|nr:hypothetical protein [Candidatus Peribacteraceae bacterium]